MQQRTRQAPTRTLLPKNVWSGVLVLHQAMRSYNGMCNLLSHYNNQGGEVECIVYTYVFPDRHTSCAVQWSKAPTSYDLCVRIRQAQHHHNEQVRPPCMLW
jgi:hypothetical protein